MFAHDCHAARNSTTCYWAETKLCTAPAGRANGMVRFICMSVHVRIETIPLKRSALLAW